LAEERGDCQILSTQYTNAMKVAWQGQIAGLINDLSAFIAARLPAAFPCLLKFLCGEKGEWCDN